MPTEAELQWVVGPQRSAVKRRGHRVWSIVPVPAAPRDVPIGLYLCLYRRDDEVAADPSSSRSARLHPIAWPALSPGLAILVVAVLAALATAGLLRGTYSWRPPALHLATLGELGWMLVALLLAFLAARVWECALLSAVLTKGSSALGLGLLGPTADPVIWRLGIPHRVAALCLAGPACAALAAFAWSARAPAPLGGALIGMAAALLVATFGLRDGPGARLYERWTGADDIPRELRWAMSARFLPAGQALASEGSRSISVAALALGAWTGGAGLFLRHLATRPATGSALPPLLWLLIVAVATLAFTIWLLRELVHMSRAAIFLRGAARLQAVTPPAGVQESWRRTSALLAHVPALAELEWRWGMAPVTTLLTNHGQRDRTFHWLASGRALVLGRTPQGQVVHLATLREGSGVGEIAFLRDEPRSADVIISRTALVVSLAYEAFASAATPEVRALMQDVVQAGQAFDGSELFRGIPLEVKERWLAAGRPMRVTAGAVAIAEGSAERWLGLLVRGTIVVREGEHYLARLDVGSVFGEMALLSGLPRRATLVAENDALIWRWEADWLEGELDRAGLRGELTTLAAGRESAR